MLTTELNRLATVRPGVRYRVEAHIHCLEEEVDSLDEDLHQRVKDSPLWRSKVRLLLSVKGGSAR